LKKKEVVSILGLVDKGLRLPTSGAAPPHTAVVSILGLVDKGLRRGELAGDVWNEYWFQSLV